MKPSTSNKGKKIRLDVGGGKLDANKIGRYKRYVGEDYNPDDYTVIEVASIPGVDVVTDISGGLPIRSGVVDEVLCVHVLEHIQDLKGVMKELQRILKPGGVLKIWVPHCFSPAAFGDSTHVRFFTFETFSQFDKKSPGSYYYDFHFEFVSSRIQLMRRWYQPGLFERLLERWINRKQRKGERFLKILPYKEWEVYSVLKKEAS